MLTDLVLLLPQGVYELDVGYIITTNGFVNYATKDQVCILILKSTREVSNG